MISQDDRSSTRPACWAALLALFAVAWGGTTAQPAQSAVLAGLGLLWLLAPARRWPSRGFAISASGLIILSACAWLPARWFAIEPWRRGLGHAGIPIPDTLSPQPHLSAEAFVWLLAGLGWLAWLMDRTRNTAARRAASRLLAGGIVLIAATSLLAWRAHFSPPGWLSERGFGPFPNRNHTGHVFALGGVLALGCAEDAMRRGWRQAVAWLGGAAVVFIALVVNYSRGGILLFAGAITVRAALIAWQRGSWKALALGASLVLVLSATVLIAGGATAARFAGGADSQVAFRAAIWRDTLSLIHNLPWCGGGLGNFRALFPFYREASVIQQSVLHPESDWLWLASETGWLGVIFALGAAVSVLWGAFPWPRGSQRPLRGAAFAAAVAALVHSGIDVPGHRIGSALMGLFVMAIARRDTPGLPDSRLATALSRFCGVGALVLAFLLARETDDAGRAAALLRSRQFPEAEEAANRALAREPLNWGAWFTRGGARACRGKTLESVADFRRARLLEPHYAGLPFSEGQFWIQSQPGLALIAWRETLRRARPPLDEEFYGAMLTSPSNPDFRSQLLTLGQDRLPLQLAWFLSAPPAEARAHLDEISAAVQHGTASQQATFNRRAEEIGKPPAGAALP